MAWMAGVVTAIRVVAAFQNEIGRRLCLEVLAEKQRGDGSEQFTHRPTSITRPFHQFSRAHGCDGCFGIELCFW